LIIVLTQLDEVRRNRLTEASPVLIILIVLIVFFVPFSLLILLFLSNFIITTRYTSLQNVLATAEKEVLMLSKLIFLAYRVDI